MIPIIRTLTLNFALLSFLPSFAQMSEYSYKRKLEGIEKQWHKIRIPEAVFAKLNPNLDDIRIYGITANSDTIEAPYILLKTESSQSTGERMFNLLNKSHSKEGYFFTLETTRKEPVNLIKLNFEQKNFDWKLRLEGSDNQQNWYTICDNYRILSLQNNDINFSYSEINFPLSNYKYYRILVKDIRNSGLLSASLIENTIVEGEYKLFQEKKIETRENKELKQTDIEITLAQAVPISSVKIHVEDTFDYYRSVSLQYATDSSETENGLFYHYAELTRGIINSFSENEFTFESTILQKIKISIENNDNQPLFINRVEVSGCFYELVARLNTPAEYFLVYGNKQSARPIYDLEIFKEKIPENPDLLKCGEELSISQKQESAEIPFFKSKIRLWVTMLFLILLLGWFSLRMIRKI